LDECGHRERQISRDEDEGQQRTEADFCTGEEERANERRVLDARDVVVDRPVAQEDPGTSSTESSDPEADDSRHADHREEQDGQQVEEDQRRQSRELLHQQSGCYCSSHSTSSARSVMSGHGYPRGFRLKCWMSSIL